MLKSICLCLSLLATTFLTACGGSSAPDEGLTYLSTAPHSFLDPQRMSWLHDLRLAKNMYEPLVTYDFTTFTIKPAVAESWSVSDDDMTYTFKIRSDAKWSNGELVTSHDFAYAWMRALLPDQVASYVELFYPIKGAKAFYDWRTDKLSQFVKDNPSGNQEAADKLWQETLDHFKQNVGIATPDDRTVIVTLGKPTPYFLELAAFITYSPVNKLSVEAVSTINANTAAYTTNSTYWSDAKKILNNGPYFLKERKFKQYIHLAANPHYWNRANMKNTALIERIVGDPQTAFRIYEDPREKIDMWLDVPTSGSLAGHLINEKRPDAHVMTAAGTYFYNYNCQPKLPSGEDNPLADARVRRAFSMAIDRQYIVDRVTQLHEPIAKTYIPPGVIKGYKSPIEAGVTFNPEQAKKLLAEAGYPNGENFPSLTLLYNTGSFHEGTAQAVIKMWENNLGINVKLQGLEVKVFGDKLRRRDFDIARAAWYGDYPDPTTFLNKMSDTSNNNDAGWINKEYNDLLDQAANTSDQTERMRLFNKAETILLEEQPMALIYQPIQLRLYDADRVKGLSQQDNPWNDWQLQFVEEVKK
ncbi:peptide ABC transporter substrate-binding protein [Poriferisphaera sp. WC338]|uniref:peptide ABC transporter substrate-binding protein n=1 Tax=Poriferisphaera sp. WC338 TaxID=3425129 RepID=UPI003D814C6C